MTFAELRLAEPIVRAVASEGYTAPTPIQIKSIPPVIAGRDVLGCAQTGTGKTGAFALPILHRLASLTDDRTNNGNPTSKRRKRNGRKPRALILCPTRELATQIFESFCTYGSNLPLRHTAIFGGVNQNKQVRALQQGVDVLIATPGRLLDLMQQGIVDLSAIQILVLDEADRMLDMGFIHDIRKVAEQLPTRRQTLLFSATMPNEIRTLADSLLRKPVFVEVEPEKPTADAIAQSVYYVTRANKPALLQRLLERTTTGRTLIFTRTKYGADKLVKALRRAGIDSAAIHSNKSQNVRTRTLAGFRSGHTPVLIATDIASRGIDVDEITHVVNYDLPNVAETYVHRIGRTARAGASGIALTFCDHEELSDLHNIERTLGKAIEVSTDEVDLTYTPTASRNGTHGSGRTKKKRSGKPTRNPGSSESRAATTGRGKRRRRRSNKATVSSGPSQGWPNGSKPGGKSSGKSGGKSDNKSGRIKRQRRTG